MIFDEAAALLDVDRQADYGDPVANMDRVAAVWSVLLGVEVTGRQVALCMAGLKLVRESQRPKRDNLVDLAAYAEIANRCSHKVTVS